MTDYVGSCLCGAVKFEVHGDFDSFYLCHCRYCQKDTGSAHAANLFSQSRQMYGSTHGLPYTHEQRSVVRGLLSKPLAASFRVATRLAIAALSFASCAVPWMMYT